MFSPQEAKLVKNITFEDYVFYNNNQFINLTDDDKNNSKLSKNKSSNYYKNSSTNISSINNNSSYNINYKSPNINLSDDKMYYCYMRRDKDYYSYFTDNKFYDVYGSKADITIYNGKKLYEKIEFNDCLWSETGENPEGYFKSLKDNLNDNKFNCKIVNYDNNYFNVNTKKDVCSKEYYEEYMSYTIQGNFG